MASKDKTTKIIIPLGVVFMSSGFIILLTILAVLAFAPQNPLITVSQFAQVAPLPSMVPTAFVKTYVVTPTPHPDAIDVKAPILLPETFIEPGDLPSFAAAADASTSYRLLEPYQPERLVIPQLGIDTVIRRVQPVPKEENGKIYHQWQVPRGYEVGWHETSAPLGQPGNTVLNGHNNIFGAVFRDLIDLELDSEIIVYHGDKPFFYRVTQQELMPENGEPLSVRFDNARWIKPTGDERITLVSCWPYLTNSHRLVVIAKPVSSLGS